MVGFIVWPCPQVSPSGFIFCGRTVACFNSRHAPWTVMRAPSAAAAQIKQCCTHEDAFSQVRWQMYAAREAGVPTVPYRLPAVTQEDGEMEGRDRVRGREGGDERRECWWREDTGPGASSLALRDLLRPSDHNMSKTKHGSSEETRLTSGRENTK